MRILIIFIALVVSSVHGWGYTSDAQTKLRDVLDIEGVRSNDLVGYGIVVGLNGTGDSVRNSPFTEDSLSHMLERLGVNVQGEETFVRRDSALLIGEGTIGLGRAEEPGASLAIHFKTSD